MYFQGVQRPLVDVSRNHFTPSSQDELSWQLYSMCLQKQELDRSPTLLPTLDIHDAIFFLQRLSEEEETEESRRNRGATGESVRDDERSQSPQRRACCWKCLWRRAQHCGSSAGPQAWRRGSEEAQVAEEPGGQQARHGGGPADTERPHHAGGCARTAGGHERFEAVRFFQ